MTIMVEKTYEKLARGSKVEEFTQEVNVYGDESKRFIEDYRKVTGKNIGEYAKRYVRPTELGTIINAMNTVPLDTSAIDPTQYTLLYMDI